MTREEPGRLFDEVADQADQGIFFTGEAPDHGVENAFRIEFALIEVKSGMVGKHGEEHQLGAAISFSEGMDSVQLSDEMANMPGEPFHGKVFQPVRIAEIGEYPFQFGLDVLGKAEPVAALADPYASDLPGPKIYILEEMFVQGQIVADVEPACRKRLVDAGQEECEFRFLQKFGIANVEEVYEYVRAWITERIGLGRVGQRLLPSHPFQYQRTTLVAVDILIENLFHAFRELHAFHRADLFALRAGENEAPRFA